MLRKNPDQYRQNQTLKKEQDSRQENLFVVSVDHNVPAIKDHSEAGSAVENSSHKKLNDEFNEQKFHTRLEAACANARIKNGGCDQCWGTLENHQPGCPRNTKG